MHDILLDRPEPHRDQPTRAHPSCRRGSVFVMGDNRDNSPDSRFGLGGPPRTVVFVPYGNIKGKAMVIWLSLSHGGLLSDLFGGTGLRRIASSAGPVSGCWRALAPLAGRPGWCAKVGSPAAIDAGARAAYPTGSCDGPAAR